LQADLIGVSGIDVPQFEFNRLLQQYELGVGSFAFILDQNGNCFTHPDFRPFVSFHLEFRLIE
jgi:hypothetical protein